jgi:hypothetical protein
MKKLIHAARAAGVAFAFVLVGAGAFAAVSPFWNNSTPGVQGPWLGDGNFNIFTLFQSHVQISGVGFNPGISASQTATQAACTVLSNDGLQEVKTSAATGAVCLPRAVAGKVVIIGNATGETIDIFSSATPFVAGTPDTINGNAGTSAYAGLTGSNHVAICSAANNGAWYCMSGT